MSLLKSFPQLLWQTHWIRMVTLLLPYVLKDVSLSLSGKTPATSQFIRSINAVLATATSPQQANKRITSRFRVISPAL